MEQLNLSLGQQISAGNHIISVGVFLITDIAIKSKHTGNFIKFKDIPKKNSPLNKIKLRFKNHLCSNEDLVFAHLQSDGVEEIINILKSNK